MDEAKFEPDYKLETLHSFNQWQCGSECAYHDAIMLNQALALPLPYLSLPPYLMESG